MDPDGDLHDHLTGQHLRFLQTARDTDGELLRVEVCLDPGGRVPGHVHARQDEKVEVVEGSIRIEVGGTTRILEVGETAVVPRRKFHSLSNAREEPAKFLLEVRPARRMEGAMRALFAVTGFVGRLLPNR